MYIFECLYVFLLIELVKCGFDLLYIYIVKYIIFDFVSFLHRLKLVIFRSLGNWLYFAMPSGYSTKYAHVCLRLGDAYYTREED